MKRIILQFFLLCCSTLFGQTNSLDYKFKDYDSLVVLTYDDYRYEVYPVADRRHDTVIITGQATIKSQDAIELNKKIRQKDSYGRSQAVTPVYDMKIMYYKRGEVKEEIQISLWTNNLYSSFPLKIQRQGECMCEGSSGHCCSEGGISLNFKKYLLDLLEKYQLPVDKEGILGFEK